MIIDSRNDSPTRELARWVIAYDSNGVRLDRCFLVDTETGKGRVYKMRPDGLGVLTGPLPNQYGEYGILSEEIEGIILEVRPTIPEHLKSQLPPELL